MKISSDAAAAHLFTLCSDRRILSVVLAALVSYGAGSLACGLAGRLALAASALLHGVLQSLRI